MGRVNISPLRDKVKNFNAGNIQNYYRNWIEFTSDNRILDIVKNGLKLNFIEKLPSRNPFEHPRSEKECQVISNEIHNLIIKKVVEPCDSIC